MSDGMLEGVRQRKGKERMGKEGKEGRDEPLVGEIWLPGVLKRAK